MKLKGVFKMTPGDMVHRFGDFLEKNGLNRYTQGDYRVAVSVKEGKKRRLKRRTLSYYNKYNCDCCGPHFVVEHEGKINYL